MINSFLAKLAVGVMLVLGLTPLTQTQNFGATVPSTPALIDTYLAANITSSDTSMTLANGTTRAGTALSGTMCFVIDVNTPTVEYVCGTASSTSVTGLSRGIDVLNPNATSSLLAYAHRRFASVQISDYPTLQFLVRKMNGTDSLDSPLQYSNSSPSFVASSTQLASKGYVDAQIVAGAAPISTNQAGIGILASTASTSQGIATATYNSQTYNLLPANGMFNSTSSATTLVPVTNSSGKLSPGFIDQTANYTWSGTSTYTGIQNFNSTTTFNATTTQFNNLPLVPTTTPTLSTQVASKNYVDSGAFSFSTSTSFSFSSLGSATTTIATSTITVSQGQRLFINASTDWSLNGDNGAHSASWQVNVDGSSVGSASQGATLPSGTNMGPIQSPIYVVTAPLSAGSHTITVNKTNSGGIAWGSAGYYFITVGK